MAVVHPEHGEIDTVHLSFLDHATFRARDDRNRANGRTHEEAGTVSDRSGPNWKEGDFTLLQKAVGDYMQTWFNTTIPPRRSPQLSRVRGAILPSAPASGEPKHAR